LLGVRKWWMAGVVRWWQWWQSRVEVVMAVVVVGGDSGGGVGRSGVVWVWSLEFQSAQCPLPSQPSASPVRRIDSFKCSKRLHSIQVLVGHVHPLHVLSTRRDIFTSVRMASVSSCQTPVNCQQSTVSRRASSIPTLPSCWPAACAQRNLLYTVHSYTVQL
jgi:hypothetical protein